MTQKENQLKKVNVESVVKIRYDLNWQISRGTNRNLNLLTYIKFPVEVEMYFLKNNLKPRKKRKLECNTILRRLRQKL